MEASTYAPYKIKRECLNAVQSGEVKEVIRKRSSQGMS